MRRSRIFMTLRNQISAAAGIPQKRSTAIFRKPMIRHPHSRDSVSVGFRTAGALTVGAPVVTYRYRWVLEVRTASSHTAMSLSAHWAAGSRVTSDKEVKRSGGGHP